MTGWPRVARRTRVERGSRADDAGVATVFVCLTLALLLVFTGTGLHLGAAMVARHRAEAAADLGALAGAAAVLNGSPCDRAGELVRQNAAELISCTQEGLDVRVRVRVEVPFAGLGAGAEGQAHAGPQVP